MRTCKYWQKEGRFPRKNSSSRRRKRKEMRDITKHKAMATVNEYLKEKSKAFFLVLVSKTFLFLFIWCALFCVCLFLFCFLSELQVVPIRGDNHCCFRMYLYFLGQTRNKENVKRIRWFLADYMNTNRNFFQRYFLGEGSKYNRFHNILCAGEQFDN